MSVGAIDVMSRPCFLLCGGGTGGHLTPGLSVAEELRRRLPEARLVFAGTGRGREREWVERHGFEFYRLPAAPWGVHPVKAAAFATRTAVGVMSALYLETRVAPDMVIGLGGYGALAPGLAAVMTGRPLALLEQNAYPGKANRLLSKWAREVHCAWDVAAEHFQYPDRVRATGNPIRRALRENPDRKAAEKFGLSPDKRTLLVLGGSQGAAAVNFALIEALDLMADCAPWLQILHSAGYITYEEVRGAYEDTPIRHCVLPFIDDMASAYAVADFAISRAGGTSLAEITAAGLPSALVPLPIAANDHQRANARVLKEAGAAIVVEQSELTAECVNELARTLIRDEQALARMAKASRALGAPDAAETIVDHLLRTLEQSQEAKAGDGRRVA